MANYTQRRGTGGTLELDRVFQALSDPTRRAVVERLSSGPAPVSELAAPFTMTLPSFLQHLKMLEESGLVQSSKTGRVRTYRVAPRTLEVAEGWMVKQRALWEKRLDQMDSYVKELHANESRDKEHPQ